MLSSLDWAFTVEWATKWVNHTANKLRANGHLEQLTGEGYFCASHNFAVVPK